MSRRRRLSDEERSLWDRMARSVTPLRRSRRGAISVADDPAAADAPEPEPLVAAVAPRAPVRRSPPTVPESSPPGPLERRFRQRLARGREPIEDRIDLHGMTQSRAHDALLRFLRDAQAKGVRVVLVVTGKGAGKDEGDGWRERGVLKRQVPLWLALPEFRVLVAGYDNAHPSHGGQGALYVRLRRAR